IEAERDFTRAFELLQQGFKKGSLHAQVMIGTISISTHPKLAIELYTDAAEKKFPWGQYRLGDEYSKGQVFLPDQKKAFELILAAANGGLAAAQTDVANRYQEGKGTEKDLV